LTNHQVNGKILTSLWLLFLLIIVNNVVSAGIAYQVTDVFVDTIVGNDTVGINHDTLTTKIDTTVVKKPQAKIDDLIERQAEDSIVQDIFHKKVFLYGNAKINYQNIELKAAYIEVNFENNTVTATGMRDSTGKVIGVPEFKQGKESFEADTIEYNFDSGKGYIYNIYTADDQGFLAGERVKKLSDNTINVFRGSYTTCTLHDHPHFRFKFKKAMVIPDSKIVTGPAYMEIEGVPTPLALPFGLFPNNAKRRSGIIIPTYGESPTRGFYLENGGYYWAINDYMDLTMLGDIYTYGSWAIKPTFRYKKRYKFTGSFAAQFAVNVVSDKDSPDYSKTNDFRIRWTHSQDPKARPNSRFNANVNIVTSNFVKYNVMSLEDYFSNEFQSSISYQTNWKGNFFLTLNASQRQNTKTHVVDISLPEITFSVNRFYPFKSKKGGKKRFYEDLAVTYSLNSKVQVSTLDSLIFTESTYKNNLRSGMIHKIPISLPIKLFKFFTWSSSINITDRMYPSRMEQNWVNDTIIDGGDTIVGYVNYDTIYGFNNILDFGISSSISTKIYGIVRIKKGPVRAIRHVFTPSVSFVYTPDFGSEKWGYYDSYFNGEGDEIFYSKYQNYLYGNAPQYKSGRIGFNFANNLEIKVPSKKDTVTGMKKIVILKSLNISGNYDLAKDSLNMSYITISGRTTLWKNLDLKFGAQFDPYALDSAGNRINKSEWSVNRRLLRKTNSNWAISFSYRLSDKDFKKKKSGSSGGQGDMAGNTQNSHPGDLGLGPDNEYVDWNIPWSLSFNYTFNFTNRLNYINNEKIPERNIVQTLGFNGQLNITPKWKITFSSGWDFVQKKVSLTSISLYRDLHCWEMRFNVIPYGPRKSWNFSINVKSALLQDLKLNKKKDFRDYY
jgi:lipopolysaccharide assembly outer membrane protein LptD (OstA)